jgi:hypothetical protein
MEFRCPTCHALIYSRRSKLCGQCGALLPGDLLLTDEQVQARRHERAWAQNLADKFSPNLPPPRSDRSVFAGSARALEDDVAPEELVRQLDLAGEFRHRKRISIWLYVLGYGLTLFPACFLYIFLRGIPLSALIVFSALVTAHGFASWWRSAPICPNCHQNIRFCPQEYCHLCGDYLSHHRCRNCGLDNSWTSWFQPYSSGTLRWITYCPGCGAYLDTSVRRWRARN